MKPLSVNKGDLAYTFLCHESAIEYLSSLGAEECDVLIAVLNTELLTPQLAQALARGAAQANTRWVKVMGRGAEDLHDAVDRASVEIGRQGYVGEGIPMTAWFEEMSRDEIVSHLRLGGLGGAAHKCESLIQEVCAGLE